MNRETQDRTIEDIKTYLTSSFSSIFSRDFEILYKLSLISESSLIILNRAIEIIIKPRISIITMPFQ